MIFSEGLPITPLHRHRMLPILLAALIPEISSQNSEKIPGDKWEHWQRDEIHMDQSH